nr:MAG TPA: hypothetical protein [Caudoviricetes sp.]DAQ57621.1 MAG TPA: hypothetical protein [Caudoviricetes sp.]
MWTAFLCKSAYHLMTLYIVLYYTTILYVVQTG